MSYFPDPELMATVICEGAIHHARNRTFVSAFMQNWTQGRVAAASLIFPSIENIAAANEVGFLMSDYERRHFGGVK